MSPTIVSFISLYITQTLSDAIKSTTAPTASTSAAEKEGKARPKQQEPPTPVTSAAALAATTTPPTAVPSTAAASIVSEADTLLAEQAENQVASLMRKLNKEDEERVSEALRRPRDRSKNKEVVTQVGTDLVLRESIQRLRPKKWLNDEVIHIYFAMLGKHDEELCRLDPSRKPSHFFKSFLMTSLLNVAGTENGQYEYKNVKRWSKKVPGKSFHNKLQSFVRFNCFANTLEPSFHSGRQGHFQSGQDCISD